jgi:hypothetical protein
VASHGDARALWRAWRTKIETPPVPEGWFQWESRTSRLPEAEARQGYKLYVSPHPKFVRDAFRGHRLEQGETYLPGWCNGSAGFVHLWTLAHQMLGKAAHGTLAEKAGFDAWESEGKIGNLCCGFAGQAYALLNLYKHTGDKEWLHRAQAQAQRAARSIMELPGGDYSELGSRSDSSPTFQRRKSGKSCLARTVINAFPWSGVGAVRWRGKSPKQAAARIGRHN